jgi:hypothetical protein
MYGDFVFGIGACMQHALGIDRVVDPSESGT